TTPIPVAYHCVSWYSLKVTTVPEAVAALAEDPGQAWLRLWLHTLVLAFLTGRPVPRVPAPVRPGWQALSPRTRECLLATAVETAVMARADALRSCYDPH